jgi:hypothetical protein
MDDELQELIDFSLKLVFWHISQSFIQINIKREARPESSRGNYRGNAGISTLIDFYHTRHAGVCTIGWPALQLNAFWNSGMLETTPLMRA